MADIYTQIWNAAGSRVQVSRRSADGTFDPAAPIHLDEQTGSDGCVAAEAVERPLFPHVDEALFAEPTFRALIALFDNYTALEDRTERTLDDPVHAREVDAFVDAVLATPAMDLAFEHLRDEIEPGLGVEEFRARVRRAWFEPFTNQFSGPEPWNVGFEHVFVGEDESGGSQPATCRDAIGGYHSWVKYYLDQKAGRLAYLGHDYEPAVAAAGLADPAVATLVMTWRVPEPDGGAGLELLKKPGGFFVGTRPECEIALGTVALFEVLAGRYEKGHPKTHHRRMKLGESFYDLVHHPQTIHRQSGELGPRIRTLYPKYRGGEAEPGGQPGGQQPGGQQPGGAGVPTQPHNTGPVRIARALPNPETVGDVGEWVELRNATPEAIDLASWRLDDERGRSFGLTGELAAGEVRRFVTRPEESGGLQLKNSGGWILLFEGTERRAAVRYGKAGQGRVKVFE